MKKIGTEVSFLAAGDNNPRNGEGTFLRLKDGAILYVYTRFTGNHWGDGCTADLAGILSRDEGRTWSEPEILLSQDTESANFMCPSLLRMENGDLGLFYLRKAPNGEDTVFLVRSEDEGKTFSAPLACTALHGHYVVIENDHVIRLQNGRILIPVNHHSTLGDPTLQSIGVGTMLCMASDDDGKTWRQICRPVHHPLEKFSNTGMQETMLYQFASGRLWALSRTDFGCQYQCFSDDNGESWSEVSPNRFFSGPPSPLLMKKTPFGTAAVWNPVPEYTTRPANEPWGRTPLVMAFSEDDGTTFPGIYAIEDDPLNGYCYPAVFAGDDYLLVGYYHSHNTGIPLNSNKIVRIERSELDLKA